MKELWEKGMSVVHFFFCEEGLLLHGLHAQHILFLLEGVVAFLLHMQNMHLICSFGSSSTFHCTFSVL